MQNPDCCEGEIHAVNAWLSTVTFVLQGWALPVADNKRSQRHPDGVITTTFGTTMVVLSG